MTMTKHKAQWHEEGPRTDYKNKGKHRSNKKNIECYYCHKRGCIKKNYPKRKGKES